MNTEQSEVETQEANLTSLGTILVASSAVLSACGGGGGGSTSTPSPGGGDAPPPVVVSDSMAARFLLQASLNVSRAQIQQVQTLGYDKWLDAQMALPASTSRWDWMVSKGFNDISYKNSEAGFDPSAWRKLISSTDGLRQRVCLALSEIFVVSVSGLVNGGGWKAFCAASYLDLLEQNCFGNYRDLLQKISTSTAMSLYLTYRGNAKFNPKTGAYPDENYAREIMQLFSIGLLQLNEDGTPKLSNGQAIETYANEDISGLARVFTGWDLDLSSSNMNTPDYLRRPLIQAPNLHETGASTFLGQTIAAGLSGEAALSASLDIIFAHPNVAPFISKQLIQRLVTSNPSAAYVGRISKVFNNNGSGVKGDLKALIKAILLDDEARNSAALSNPLFGKVKEPILRFVAWARTFTANSAGDAWAIGDTSDVASRLGQSPLRSPSVFNFFRPGYVPPNSGIASANLVAPEMQIVNESSVVGYINFMQSAITGVRYVGDLRADYSSLLTIAGDANALVDELNLLLAANQISSANISLIKTAVNSMPSSTDALKTQRIYAALTLVLATPEFIVLK